MEVLLLRWRHQKRHKDTRDSSGARKQYNIRPMEIVVMGVAVEVKGSGDSSALMTEMVEEQGRR